MAGNHNPLLGDTRTPSQLKSAKNLKARKEKQLLKKMAVETALATLGPAATEAKVDAIAQVLTGDVDAKIAVGNPTALKVLINKARQKFSENAEHYVEQHLLATRAAYAANEFGVAIEASQWAMENLGDEEERLIRRPAAVQSGPGPIMIGVKVGGMKETE